MVVHIFSAFGRKNMYNHPKNFLRAAGTGRRPRSYRIFYERVQKDASSLRSLPDRNVVAGNGEGAMDGMASKTGGMNEARTSSSLRATWESRRAHNGRRPSKAGARWASACSQHRPTCWRYGPRSRRPLARSPLFLFFSRTTFLSGRELPYAVPLKAEASFCTRLEAILII